MKVSRAALLLAAPIVNALLRQDGTGKLPAMGWNSWNTYLCDINATLFFNQAQAMLDHRLHVRASEPCKPFKSCADPHVRKLVTNM